MFRSKTSRSNTKNDPKKYIKQKLYFRADGVRTSINSRGAPAGRPPRLRTNNNSRCAPAVFPSGSSESPYTSKRRRREFPFFLFHITLSPRTGSSEKIANIICAYLKNLRRIIALSRVKIIKTFNFKSEPRSIRIVKYYL